MRKVGFGLTEREVKGHEYIYMWHYANGKRKEEIVQDRGIALKILQRYAKQAKKESIKHIDERLGRYEKQLS